MKILLCPDKFKGSFSAVKVCSALHKGLLSKNSDLKIVSHPMADGGDGSMDILKSYFNLECIELQTFDPLGRTIETNYYHSDEAAFIELASASGLTLLNKMERNPMLTSTMGTGLLMKDAIERGFYKIFLLVGGSATNDGGIGIAKALGFDFLDREGKLLDPIGSSLNQIHKVVNNNLYDFDKVEIIVLSDVTNPMYGPTGAAFVYAAQKGATKEEIQILDKGLKNFSNVLKSQMNIDLSSHLGMGAAGAVGASLFGLLNADLKNGFQFVANITQLEDAIKNSDLVITGEGKVDQTSYHGKVVGKVLDICKNHDISCGIVGGIIEEENVDAYFEFQKSIIKLAKDQNDAMASPEKYLFDIAVDIGSHELYKITKKQEQKMIIHRMKGSLLNDGYTFERVDFNRPWGGFFVMKESDKLQFINQYFEGLLNSKVNIEMKLSPKILIVAPNKRLSWQYHNRRSELWQVVNGPIGVIKSDTDIENSMKVYESGERIELSNAERHRLIGLEDYGIVAEIWVHEDPMNPSDENDIVRLQDDFGR